MSIITIPRPGNRAVAMSGTHHCEVGQAQAVALNETPGDRSDPADGTKGL